MLKCQSEFQILDDDGVKSIEVFDVLHEDKHKVDQKLEWEIANNVNYFDLGGIDISMHVELKNH